MRNVAPWIVIVLLSGVCYVQHLRVEVLTAQIGSCVATLERSVISSEKAIGLIRASECVIDKHPILRVHEQVTTSVNDITGED